VTLVAEATDTGPLLTQTAIASPSRSPIGSQSERASGANDFCKGRAHSYALRAAEALTHGSSFKGQIWTRIAPGHRDL